MIPGEYLLDGPDLELNAGRPDVDARGQQHGRPAGPGRLALPLLRGQPGAGLRPREGLRHAPRPAERHRGPVRAGRRQGRAADPLRRPAGGLRLQRPGRWAGSTTRTRAQTSLKRCVEAGLRPQAVRVTRASRRPRPTGRGIDHERASSRGQPTRDSTARPSATASAWPTPS